MNTQIGEDIGGSLQYDPPQPGRPTAATVELLNPDGSVLQVQTSAVVDAVSTTLAADAAPDNTSITVSSASSIEVGRHYRIDNGSGQGEWVRVASVDGAIVSLARELSYAYETGDAFVGNRLSHTVLDDYTGTRDTGYQARWVYTIDGEQHRARTLWDVVAAPWPDEIVAPWEFAQYAGSLADYELELTRRAGLQFADEIADATELVRLQLLEDGHRPDLFLDFSAFKRPIAHRVRLTWAEDGMNIPPGYRDTPEIYLQQRRDLYHRHLSQALNVTRSYDENQDLALTNAEQDARRGQPRVLL